MAEPKTTAPAAPATTEVDPAVSRDAQHSAYAPASAPKDAEYPPPGPSVEQTLGTPTEAT